MMTKASITSAIAISLLFLPTLQVPAASAQTSSNEGDKSSEDTTILQRGQRITGRVVTTTRDGLGDAAMSPLEDLNLRRDVIPAELAKLQTPYDPVGDVSCAGLAREVRVLDTYLDIDEDVKLARQRAKELEEEQEEEERSRLANIDIAEEASDFALGTVASEARGLIPFRGLVRQVSGAKGHAARVEEAFNKAYLRRAFLKGMGLSKGCSYPAAPLDVTLDLRDRDEGAPIRYRTAKPEGYERAEAPRIIRRTVTTSTSPSVPNEER